MPKFFVTPSEIWGDEITISGPDAAHISKSLRMQPGEPLIVCNGQGTDYHCRITAVSSSAVALKVEQTTPSKGEPTVAVTLYQGLPKSDKMDWIVQKAVEVGASTIVPVQTARSVAVINQKAGKKADRWQRIAAEAAGQCGRGIVPTVEPPQRFNQVLAQLQENGNKDDFFGLVLYEGGGQPLPSLLRNKADRIGIFIGPEGGFAPEEVEALTALGWQTATLGPRILRCETAPIATLSVVMALTGNME